MYLFISHHLNNSEVDFCLHRVENLDKATLLPHIIVIGLNFYSKGNQAFSSCRSSIKLISKLFISEWNRSE